MEKIKSPAYKHMSREQLEASIALGTRILEGEVDLVELDGRSLEVRGKVKGGGKASRKVEEIGKRKSATDDEGSVEGEDGKRRKANDVHLEEDPEERDPKDDDSRDEEPSDPKPKQKAPPEGLTPYLKKIALSHKTPFQKKVLTALCQVPRGHYTTYAAISKHLSSSPRAVGNALKNNPFAPQVPCHRVLASGGGIGGFHGSWGRNGKEGVNDEKKRRLLRDEGVRFDGKGRVVGRVWEGFR